jgi:hypothetical protein
MPVVYNENRKPWVTIQTCIDFQNPRSEVTTSSFRDILTGLKFHVTGNAVSLMDNGIALSGSYFYSEFNPISSLSSADDISIMAWISCSITSSQQSIIQRDVNTAKSILTMIDGKIYFSTFNVVNSPSTISSSISSGWNFFAATHKTTVRDLYKNGDKVQFLSASHTARGSAGQILVGGFAGNLGYSGIGEIRVYGTYLTEKDILSHFSATRERYGV